MEFYDQYGIAVCYSAGDENIFLWSGQPVGFIVSGRIYSTSGKVLGWFEKGWLNDRENKHALFSIGAQGGPKKPVRRLPPTKAIRRVRPVKASKQEPPSRPIPRAVWSEYSNAAYFQQ